jgi:serine/threonine-protein kinase RsbW
MELRCEPDGELEGTIVATLEGSLDVLGADELLKRVTPELDATTRSLMIDLTSVSLITSAGIGALVRLLFRVQSLGGRLAVVGPNPRVREVIEVVMLTGILGVSDSVEEARRRLQT